MHVFAACNFDIPEGFGTQSVRQDSAGILNQCGEAIAKSSSMKPISERFRIMTHPSVAQACRHVQSSRDSINLPCLALSWTQVKIRQDVRTCNWSPDRKSRAHFMISAL
ncbi:MAG: hypothetical protein IPP40_09315 [bacterium]|nr:hypothetical protein [bacterium]